MDKLIFRTTSVLLLFIPLSFLYYGKTKDILFLEILSFSIFSIYVLTGIMSFKKDMIIRMANKESYVENIFRYAFNHEFKFGLMIFSGLTFSYYGYDIFAFLIILGGAGEAYLHYNVKKLHLDYINEN